MSVREIFKASFKSTYFKNFNYVPEQSPTLLKGMQQTPNTKQWKIHNHPMKLQTTITHGHRCKNERQNFTKSNPTIHKKDNSSWPSGFYLRNAKLVSCLKTNQFNLLNYQIKKGKLHNHFNRCRKCFWQNLTSIPNKNFHKIRNRRKVPQCEKECLKINNKRHAKK